MFLNILITVVFILVILLSTTFSCSNYIPYNTDVNMSSFESFSNVVNSDNLEHEKSTSIFGFDGLFNVPTNVNNEIDTISVSKGSTDCLGNSCGLTNSLGGLCLTPAQQNSIKSRGGNAVANIKKQNCNCVKKQICNCVK